MYYRNKEELEEGIKCLQLKQANDFELLKQQIQLTSESIKPLNLLKKSFIEITSNQAFKSNLIDTALALGTNYLLNKLRPKKDTSKLTGLLATILEFTLFKLKM